MRIIVAIVVYIKSNYGHLLHVLLSVNNNNDNMVISHPHCVTMNRGVLERVRLAIIPKPHFRLNHPSIYLIHSIINSG